MGLVTWCKALKGPIGTFLHLFCKHKCTPEKHRFPDLLKDSEGLWKLSEPSNPPLTSSKVSGKLLHSTDLSGTWQPTLPHPSPPSIACSQNGLKVGLHSSRFARVRHLLSPQPPQFFPRAIPHAAVLTLQGVTLEGRTGTSLDLWFQNSAFLSACACVRPLYLRGTLDY